MVLLGGCPTKSHLQSVKKIALFGGCPSRSDLQFVKKMVLLSCCPCRSDLHFVKKMVLLGGSRSALHFVKKMVLLGLEAVPAEMICILSVKKMVFLDACPSRSEVHSEKKMGLLGGSFGFALRNCGQNLSCGFGGGRGGGAETCTIMT